NGEVLVDLIGGLKIADHEEHACRESRRENSFLVHLTSSIRGNRVSIELTPLWRVTSSRHVPPPFSLARRAPFGWRSRSRGYTRRSPPRKSVKPVNWTVRMSGRDLP